MFRLQECILLLISLLAVIWGASGEPPGGGQITTKAVIHFLPDDTLHLKAEPVQGLRYFSTGTGEVLQALKPQSVIVYPSSIETVVGTGRVLVPGQVAPVVQEVQPANTLSVAAISPGILFTPQVQDPATVSAAVSYGSTAAPSVVSYGSSPTIVYPSTPSPVTPSSTPYGTQPPHGIYQEGVKPLPPGFLYSTTPVPIVPTTPAPESHNVDITYDSLTSNSHVNSYVTGAPTDGFKTPPPMKATTYGPPKPVFGPFFHFRRPGHNHVPHYHYRYGLSKRPLIQFYYPTKHLQKARYPPSPIKSSYDSLHYSVPSGYTPTSASSITKAVFHPYASYSNYAPIHAYSSFLGKSDSNVDETKGDASKTQSNYKDSQAVASESYSTIVASYDDNPSDDYYSQVEIKNSQDNKSSFVSPIIVYREIRPPVKVYHKPEMMDPKFNSFPKYDRADIFEMASTTPENIQEYGVDYSTSNNNWLSEYEWMPINAPENAVPARSFNIAPPDLSVNRTRNSDEFNMSHGDSILAGSLKENSQKRTFSDSEQDKYVKGSDEMVSATEQVN